MSLRPDEKIVREMKSIIEKYKPISEGMVFDEKALRHRTE